jgi:hypothetical protein
VTFEWQVTATEIDVFAGEDLKLRELDVTSVRETAGHPPRKMTQGLSLRHLSVRFTHRPHRMRTQRAAAAAPHGTHCSAV